MTFCLKRSKLRPDCNTYIRQLFVQNVCSKCLALTQLFRMANLIWVYCYHIYVYMITICTYTEDECAYSVRIVSSSLCTYHIRIWVSSVCMLLSFATTICRVHCNKTSRRHLSLRWWRWGRCWEGCSPHCSERTHGCGRWRDASLWGWPPTGWGWCPRSSGWSPMLLWGRGPLGH